MGTAGTGAFLFADLRTNFRVQDWLGDDEATLENEYEAVDCIWSIEGPELLSQDED